MRVMAHAVAVTLRCSSIDVEQMTNDDDEGCDDDEGWEQVRQSEGSGNCPGWTSTSSVLSAIVATQAATEKPVWGPAALR